MSQLAESFLTEICPEDFLKLCSATLHWSEARWLRNMDVLWKCDHE